MSVASRLQIVATALAAASLCACGKPAPKTSADASATPQAVTPATPQDDQAVEARTVARASKKLAGQCDTDASCDALITDGDLASAKQDLTQVLGTSATGPKSRRAPSGYFVNLKGWSCPKAKDACAREWFTSYQIDIRRAVKEGDASDDPWTIPKDKTEVTADLPFTRDDLVAANVSFKNVDNVWMCRSAILYKRWRATGDKSTTKADLQDALRACFKDGSSA